jgi:hypothetical protein
MAINLLPPLQRVTVTIEGKVYSITYSSDISPSGFPGSPSSGRFLQPLKIEWSGNPFTNYTEPGKSDFDRIINLDIVKLALASDYSRIKGYFEKNGLKNEANKAAEISKQTDTWNRINPGDGQNSNIRPISEDPATYSPADPSDPDKSTPLVIPKELLEIGKKDDEKLKTLYEKIRGEKKFIQYPYDAIYDKSQDSLSIEIFSYQAPQQQFLANPDTLKDAFSTVVTKGLQRNTNIKDFLAAIRLPVPQQITSTNEVEWGQKSANALEAGAFYGAIGPASTALNGNIVDALKNAGTSASNLLSNITSGKVSGGMQFYLSGYLASVALGKIGINVDPSQFITRAIGATINPNLELLFSGPKLRLFNFTFEFAPNNPKDADSIRYIFRLLKQGMSPKKNSNNLLFLGSPNVFRLKYMNGNRRIKGINSFKICALLGCDFDYTAGGSYAAYEDEIAVSQPARMQMRLSFQELTPIFASDYDLDQDDPSIKDLGTDFSNSPDNTDILF